MSALVYLTEELGDARLRCDQLLRYVDKATKLIEKSSHKDHFFEVAGDLIRGIPETSFKLHKALQAVALAANRIDYEEIKQDLRPEKAEELERVLKDVRIRQVQRRSQPMLNPGTVVEQLRGLAQQTRQAGRLDTDSLGELIASLEAGAPKVAGTSGERVAVQFEALAHALENPPAGEMPSRLRLAQVLRKTLAEHLEVRTAADQRRSLPGRMAARLPPDRLFKRMQEAVNGMLETRATVRDLHEELGDIRRDATGTAFTNNYESPDIKKVEGELYELDHAIGSAFRNVERLERTMRTTMLKTAAADDDKRSRYEEGKSADPTENMSEEDAKAWKENTEEYGDKLKKEAKGELSAPPGLPTFSPMDAATSVEGAIVSLKHLYRMLAGNAHVSPGSINRVFKDAIGEMGAAAWNLNLPDLSALLEKSIRTVRVRNVDKFAAGDVQPRDIAELEGTLDSLVANARMTKVFGMQGNYRKLLFNLMKVIGDVYTITAIFDIPGTGFLARVIKAIVPYSGARPMLNFTASRALTAGDGDDEKLSRFEEGKPADPTENMSEEDAKAWKENTDEYGDKFKEAGRIAAKKIPAPDDPSIIDEIMSWHGGQGTRLYSVGSTWNAGRPVDADDAEEAYDELKRKRADRDALEAFEDHLSQHGIKVAGARVVTDEDWKAA